MSQRILVFESDTAFANDVKSSFEQLGAQVDVAYDGPSGLELAQGKKPDLILLTIELPGMNGFLVCKKIKKTAELENVPLVILSSEVDEETFEQHKKLRTRADEYIRKPIGFAELLERVKRFVPLNGAGEASLADDEHAEVDEETIEIEDAFVDEEVIVMSDDTTPPPELRVSSGPSAEVEQFADEALDALVLNDDKPAPVAAAPEPAPAPTRASIPHHPVPSAPGPRMSAAPAEPTAASAASLAEIERLKRELAAAEQKLQAAEKRSATAEQRASGAEKALDAAKKTGGVSSRELLDLREQLNKKDHELLDLRDQVTARDKQLIDGSDKSLALERDLQDTRDKADGLQREVDKKNEVVAALTTDKESAKKRLDDMKARMERSEVKVKDLGVELDGIKAQHALDLEEAHTAHAQTEAKLRAEQAATTERLKEEHAVALAAQKRAHADELSELREEHAVAQKSAAERASQEKNEALAELRAELLAQQSAKLADAAGAHKAELSAALSAHENELRRTREQLEQKAAADLAEATDKHRLDMARVGKALSEAESRYALLEERHEETEQGRAVAEKSLRTVTGERDELAARAKTLDADLSSARAKLQSDSELLDRVRKAMAIGLGLLEEQKQNPPS